jgi:predicted  nucleic acid-binding Zn-ribbon protein
LADYQKIYELSKLRRSIELSISKTNSVKSQRALRDLTNEITQLEQSGAKISEY